MTEATRDRLITAAMALYAENGTQGTTIGDIEEGAGLTRRGGAFYKHFRSKEEILEAGIERQARHLESVSGVMDLMPLGDLRAELTLLCKWLLAELTREHDVVRVLEKEGDQVPALRSLMFERIIQAGSREAAEFVQRWLKRYPKASLDVGVLAAILVGAVVNYRRTQWTFGGSLLDIEEDRFVAAWVDAWVHFFEATPPPFAEAVDASRRKVRRARS